MNSEKHIDLVTGATTGLGKQLIKRLVAKGDEVRVILQTHPSVSNEWKTLPPKVEIYVADLTLANDADQQNLEKACAGADNIFHLAGAVYNYRYTNEQLLNTNAFGTENLMNACTNANKKSGHKVHVIFASSWTVYGYKRPNETLTEESQLKPASPYSESKVIAEQIIQSFADANSNMDYTTLRLSTFYGEDYKSSFNKVFKLIEAGKAMYVGDGKNHISFIHESEAADAMILACQSRQSLNKIYNICDGIPYTVKELFTAVAKSLGVSPPHRGIPLALARITRKIVNINYDEYEFVASDRVISIEKAKKELGFNPKTSIYKEGMQLLEEYKRSKQ